jgi:hypothetical protein
MVGRADALRHADTLRGSEMDLFRRLEQGAQGDAHARALERENMTAAPSWREAKLFDLHGLEMGKCRVPAVPFPPGVILWGNRYFQLALPDGNYVEVTCYLVPIERMYLKTRKPVEMPFRKTEP